jgi:hypothetical protein
MYVIKIFAYKSLCLNQFLLFFQGKLTSYESSYGLESSISKDGQDYADVNAEINTGSPSIQVKHLLNLTIVNLTRISGLLTNISILYRPFHTKKFNFIKLLGR